MKVLKKNYWVDFMGYGHIKIPKGTKTTHKTAMGIDENYNFVDEFDWIAKDYPEVANILKWDMETHGIDIPVARLKEI